MTRRRGVVVAAQVGRRLVRAHEHPVVSAQLAGDPIGPVGCGYPASASRRDSAREQLDVCPANGLIRGPADSARYSDSGRQDHGDAGHARSRHDQRRRQGRIGCFAAGTEVAHRMGVLEGLDLVRPRRDMAQRPRPADVRERRRTSRPGRWTQLDKGASANRSIAAADRSADRDALGDRCVDRKSIGARDNDRRGVAADAGKGARAVPVAERVLGFGRVVAGRLEQGLVGARPQADDAPCAIRRDRYLAADASAGNLGCRAARARPGQRSADPEAGGRDEILTGQARPADHDRSRRPALDDDTAEDIATDEVQARGHEFTKRVRARRQVVQDEVPAPIARGRRAGAPIGEYLDPGQRPAARPGNGPADGKPREGGQVDATRTRRRDIDRRGCGAVGNRPARGVPAVEEIERVEGGDLQGVKRRRQPLDRIRSIPTGGRGEARVIRRAGSHRHSGDRLGRAIADRAADRHAQGQAHIDPADVAEDMGAGKADLRRCHCGLHGSRDAGRSRRGLGRQRGRHSRA